MKNYFLNRNWIVVCYIIALCFPFTVMAQNVSVKGQVIDSSGEPIIGASILEQHTTNGTITDFDGHFVLTVTKDAVIKISYIGFIPQSLTITKTSNLKVVLKEDTQMLAETVVIGYGTMKKSDMTGAISSVDTDELIKRPTTNAAEALQGKIAGVNIQKTGGNAGAGVRVKIRGVKTFGSNEPLYVIDGFAGSIRDVNPQDIASMEVLKDGAAAAIYGSVAANGVILITTKSGKRGEMKVDFSSYISSTKIDKELEFLDAKQYVSMHKMMYDNYNAQYPSKSVSLPEYITKSSDVNTDWQNAMLRKGLTQNYMISIRGGSEKAKYAVSYNRDDEKGIYLGNDYRQDNARVKLHLEKNIFDLDTNLSLRYVKSKQRQYSSKEMYMISPLVPIYDSNEEYGYGLTDKYGLPNNRNVMADYENRQAFAKAYYTTANFALTAHILPYLDFKTSYGYSAVHNRDQYHAPSYIADMKGKNLYPTNSENTSYWEEQTFENVLSFDYTFDKHHINAMIGTSIIGRKNTWSGISVEGKTMVYKVEDGKLISDEKPAGFLDQNYTTINAGDGGTYSGNGSNWTYNRASMFGRINYSYADKYLLQATMRRDGSSKFGKDSRWGTFPSVALGWRISQEDFFPKDIILTNLKLRTSWGRLGNENALSYYDFQALISTSNTKYQGYVRGSGENPWSGSIARALKNTNLQWETTDSKNIGLDFGLWNNKLQGAINYYNNETKDLLITKVLAPSAGFDNPIMNVGKIRNSGFELELSWTDRMGDLSYNLGMNMSTTKNKVLSLANDNQVLYGEGLKYGDEHFPTQTKEGKPIGSFYLYQADGLFQSNEEVQAYKNENGVLLQPDAQAGDVKFVDINKDGSINEDDKKYSGSGIPKIEINFNLGAEYHGFDFSAVVGSAWGHKLYNGNKYFYEGMNSGSNFLKSSLDAWTPSNKNTSVPRAVYQDPNGNLKESTRFLEKGDFIRLRQIQLGYSFPSSWLNQIAIERIRLYMSGENLITITDYDGIDPEFSRESVLNTGIDTFIYPFTRSYTVGIQVTF